MMEKGVMEQVVPAKPGDVPACRRPRPAACLRLGGVPAPAPAPGNAPADVPK